MHTILFKDVLTSIDPVIHETKQVATSGDGEKDLVVPGNTQPKSVSKAMGVPVGPLHQPCKIASTKTSIPRSMSSFPEQPNPESARSMSSRRLHSFFNGMGANGRSQGTLGTIIAMTTYF